MQKIAVRRQDGIVRIGVVCATHFHHALTVLAKERRSYWIREYSGEQGCEVCGCHDAEFVSSGVNKPS